MPPGFWVVQERNSAGAVTVALGGQLVGEGTAEHLRGLLEASLMSDGVRRMELDLSALSLVDLEGVAALILVQYHAQTQNKDLRVTGAQGQVAAKLGMTGVLGFLQ